MKYHRHSARLCESNWYSACTTSTGKHSPHTRLTSTRTPLNTTWYFTKKNNPSIFNTIKHLYLCQQGRITCNVCARFRAVPAVPLPARSAVPPQGSRWETQHGHHYRGLPLVDVARPQLPTAVPVLRLPLPALQRVQAVHSVSPPGRLMAGQPITVYIFTVTVRDRTWN